MESEGGYELMAKAIIDNAENYAGKYVATNSFNDKKVVTSGKDPGVVRQKAISKGHASPVVFFVPCKNTIHIY